MDLEQIMEQLERVPERIRYAVVFGVAVLVVLLYIFLLRMPAQDELARQQSMFDDVQQEYLKNKAVADDLQNWQAEIRRLRIELEDALQRLPKDVETEELLISVPNIAKKNALTVSEFSVEAERRKQGYAEVPLTLKMRGAYQGVGSFAQEIGEQSRIMAVNGLTAKAAKREKGEADEVKLEIDAEVVTYRFLDSGNAGGGQQ